MKIKKVFVVSLWISFFLHLTPTMSWAGGISCSGPTDKVQITVKQENELPPIYSYVVKNLRKSPITIYAIALGVSDHEEMYQLQDNVPKTFTSPKGWEGGTSFTDESILMRIFWKTKEAITLTSGQLFGGFKLEMPPPLKKMGDIYNIYGTLAKALDLKKAPFNILFLGGGCVWGRVQEQEIKLNATP